MPELVNRLVVKCFTGPARREADEAKFIWRKVFTACQANFQADLDAMEHSWLDITKGMPRLVAYERNKEGAEGSTTTNIKSALTPKNPGGYNFAEENSCTSVIHNVNATVYSATDTATLGETIYLPNEDDSFVRSTADGAFEDYETGDEAGRTINFDRMENVT